MKAFFYLILNIFAVGCSLAQSQMGIAHWHVTVKAVDENKQPVPAARVTVGYIGAPRPGQVVEDASELFREKSGETDQNGTFSASNTDVSLSLGIDLEKPDYYNSHLNYGLLFPENFPLQTLAKNRNPILTVLLRKIQNPVPVYAKGEDLLAFNKTGSAFDFKKRAGYDLMAGDLVAPDGKGETSDIVFTREFNKRSAINYDEKLVVSFSNPGDGILEVSRGSETNSAFRSPYQAPPDGYQPQLTRESHARPEQNTVSDFDQKGIYLIRVRTVLDGSGRVKSANYGKIYGDLETRQFAYYLNPTPNDRNIEFDPKQNLLPGLESFDRPSAP